MVGGTWRSPGLAVLLGGFFFVALWELYRPRRTLDCSVTPRWLGNLAVYFINAALLAWVFTAQSAAASRIETNFGIELPRWPPSLSALDFILGFLVLDCLRYWMHRLFHRVPWLWRLHSLHHADADLDVSTSYRHHPIEFLVGSAFFGIFFLISGFPADIAGAYLLSASLLAYCQHGNIALPPSCERVLQKILVTPDMHRLHHSVVAAEANSNFGFMFSFWDTLFSTHRTISPAAHNDIRFGVAEIRNPSFAQMLLLPLIVAPLDAGTYSKPAIRKPSSR